MKRCELCKSMAKIYCESDRASLCWTCDAKVHSANFLVARHSRCLLCHVCQSPTPWSASGKKLWPSTAAVCGCCAVDRIFDDVEERVGGNINNGRTANAYGDAIELKDSVDENHNVVVARTSVPLPPAASSSSAEEFFSGNGGGFLKRKRQNVADITHEDEMDSSLVNMNHHSPSSSTVSSSAGTLDRKKKLRDRNMMSGECMHVRNSKSRRTLEFDLNL